MLKYLKKYWLFCLLAPLLMLGEITMDLKLPDMMKTIIDDGVQVSNMDVILQTGAKMLGLLIFGGCCGIGCSVCANIAALNFGNDLRKDLFSRIMDLSFQQNDHLSTGSLITRITNDITQVQHMVRMSIRGVVRCTVMFFGGIVMLYRQSSRFALIVACALPFLAGFVIFFLKKVTPLYVTIQSRIDKINSLMQENIAGARVVKAYTKERAELEHFAQANDALYDTNLQAQTTLAFLNPCVNTIMNICIICVLYCSGIAARVDGGITSGETMASITYVTLILNRVIFMANIFQTFTRASASWGRIKEVLHTQPHLTDGPSVPSTDRTGEIEFDHVCFSYPDTPDSPVLKDISFKVAQGQTLAIIGATGSGKSTLSHLIPRFYDVTSGCIRVDGLDVREYPLQQLRSKIGTVLQKPELFSRSIGENIAWGKENAGPQEISHAAAIAQASDFIEATANGYDTQVTESGHSLSGGQKQRLSVARAVLKQPEILILDDSGSALDLKTEAALHKAFHEAFRDTTTIIIAQRIASVRNADRILVLEGGTIAASGTHEELLQTSEVYLEIYNSQLKKEVC